jgi:tRNA(adenine34) deaminase
MDSQAQTDKQFMTLALEQARMAAAHDEVPVGAVVVKEGRVIGSGYNLTRRMQDAMLHAEIVAMRQAAVRLGNWYMQDCTLYVTVEPCIQCAGTILLARMGRLVFGTSEPKFGACGSICDILANDLLNHRVDVTSGILSAQSSGLLKKFFRTLRKK